MKLRSILTAASLALLLTLPAAAQPYGSGGGSHWRAAGRFDRQANGQDGGLLGQRMIQFLQLTADQISQAKSLIASSRQQAVPLRDQLRQNRQQLLQLMSTSNPDPAELGKLLLAQKTLRDQLHELRQNEADQFAKLLTSEQQARFATLRSWWQSRPRPGMGGPGPQGAGN